MALNNGVQMGDLPPQHSDSEDSRPASPVAEPEAPNDPKNLKSALRQPTATPAIAKPELPEQPDPKDLDVNSLTPLSPEIIARQATINIGTIGHGKTENF